MILVNYEKLSRLNVKDGRITLSYAGWKSATITTEPIKVKLGTDRIVILKPDGNLDVLHSSERKFGYQDIIDEALPKLNQLVSNS